MSMRIRATATRRVPHAAAAPAEAAARPAGGAGGAAPAEPAENWDRAALDQALDQENVDFGDRFKMKP